MDVNELIDIEQKYIIEHKDIPFIVNEFGEIEYANNNDDLNFLESGTLKKTYEKVGSDIKECLKNKGLNEFEILILLCFIGNLSYAFRWDTYDNKPTPIPEMCDGLDSVLEKSPTFRGDTLRRSCTPDDMIDFKTEEIYTFHHYLTTTKDHWVVHDNMYVITPKHENTNARCIYELINSNREGQVSFKRNTSFKINRIEDYGDYKYFYMNEI